MCRGTLSPSGPGHERHTHHPFHKDFDTEGLSPRRAGDDPVRGNRARVSPDGAEVIAIPGSVFSDGPTSMWRDGQRNAPSFAGRLAQGSPLEPPSGLEPLTPALQGHDAFSPGVTRCHGRRDFLGFSRGSGGRLHLSSPPVTLGAVARGCTGQQGLVLQTSRKEDGFFGLHRCHQRPGPRRRLT